ncbi:MAG: PilT/PilU family type 4a pilus ATPase [Candidatus Competibacteraceae bacterium]|nr:PilT/PilU family type 4a pilus ATPase [Candidatus Competibacteraceae bacterium]MBK7983426.1 PilT/PilU family type 4a pilus ATPase [Candidatus Competibacteraceae bacterium]MBK8898034.1 PilT/PilU family type 4a pilus ATPase [Candidatus Competibacteraceae bacterium]MBK8961838.1 PilT/PilU family type 4a pilus ATPase [Candidatus Competibacteraceae bacterium]MBK9951051.1 PilT/PilU family type 4a pilus ATPase [Candidatus Competibacteraceae bacterium]
MNLKDFLSTLARRDGSDIYLSTGAPPCGKFQGVLKMLDKEPLPPGRVKQIAYSVMDAAQIADFEKTLEMNLAISEPNVGRFRVNIFKQRGEISMVIRNIKTDIPSIEALGLPSVLTQVIMEKRGLILFVGGTGSGKSTSLAALIDHRNGNSGGHIITVEDPIEFVHRHKRSVINQREVGVDTLSYADALKNTLRQAPDVILIGEIRDRETMEHALAFAETGHLAISTLHANSANQALDRIVNFFPEERRPQLLADLSGNLRAFVSQRLIPTVDGKRVAAIEVLLNSPMVEALIKRGEVGGLKEIMEKSSGLGMQTFDQALFALHQAGKISFDEAIKNADSANNLRLRINLSGGAKAVERPGSSGLALEAIEEPEEEEKPASATNLRPQSRPSGA